MTQTIWPAKPKTFTMAIYRKCSFITNLDNMKPVGLEGRNPRKIFAFAFASSYPDVLDECGNWEKAPSIHLPALSSTRGFSKREITSEENDELEQPEFLCCKLPILTVWGTDLQS